MDAPNKEIDLTLTFHEAFSGVRAPGFQEEAMTPSTQMEIIPSPSRELFDRISGSVQELIDASEGVVGRLNLVLKPVYHPLEGQESHIQAGDRMTFGEWQTLRDASSFSDTMTRDAIDEALERAGENPVVFMAFEDYPPTTSAGPIATSDLLLYTRFINQFDDARGQRGKVLEGDAEVHEFSEEQLQQLVGWLARVRQGLEAKGSTLTPGDLATTNEVTTYTANSAALIGEGPLNLLKEKGWFLTVGMPPFCDEAQRQAYFDQCATASKVKWGAAEPSVFGLRSTQANYAAVLEMMRHLGALVAK